MSPAAAAPLKAPFPYFGGKHRAAALVWAALGDPSGYVEPFTGSAAVLLARPPFTGRRVETLNDVDGWLVNTWRAIQHDPATVARHAYGPVTEIDYHARLAWLQDRRTDKLVSWLEGDPEHHDAKAAGWWLYVAACGIGDPFGPGPWRIVDGHLINTRSPGGVNRELPHLGNAGHGVNRELPHLGNAGRGVNRDLDSDSDSDSGDPADKLDGLQRLTGYMHALAHRLQRVRITCGDWSRVVKPSVLRSGAGGDGSRALFLDPPYATSSDLYGGVATDVAHDVRAWCITDAPAGARIILCGYDTEHDALTAHGWERIEGRAGGGAGYATNNTNGRRERMWLSPACLSTHRQDDLFGGQA